MVDSEECENSGGSLEGEIYAAYSRMLPHAASLLELRKRELVCKAKCQSGMLEHVIKVEVFNLILCRVNLLVAVTQLAVARA